MNVSIPLQFVKRALLRGRACNREGQHPKALSNHAVRQLVRIASLGIELRIQRLKWLQQLVESPQQHEHILTALFAPLACEITPKHYWLDQAVADVHALGTVADNECLSSVVHAGDVFWDVHVRDEFLRMDCAILRSAALTHKIPCTQTPFISAEQAGDPMGHVCEMVVDGARCGRAFSTLRGLLAHQRRAKGHERVLSFVG